MSTRREFLTAAPLRDAIEAAADDLAALPLAGNTIRLGKAAMASDFEVILNPGEGALLAAASGALDEIDRLEDQLSIYRPHSELSRLNARAASESVPLESRLLALLQETLRYAGEFDGAFDPTAGPLVALWRQCRRERRIPTADELAAARSQIGFRDVAIDSERGTIEFRRPGLELNLNAIGKGYALDRATEILVTAGARGDAEFSEHVNERDETGKNVNPTLPRDMSSSLPPPRGEGRGGGGERLSASPDNRDAASANSADISRSPSFLLHGGHSSIVARGDLAGARGWPIAIRHPLVPNRTLATIVLQDRALSTSGSAVQFYRVGNRRFGHLLDPRTGWPAEGILAVTVLAPTAAQAEALSTAFFVAGVEKAREYCHNQTDVAALIVPAPTAGQTLEPVSFGFTESDLFRDTEGWPSDTSVR